MVHMYTRVNDFSDVIMRETKEQFEVELRRRDNIISQFRPGMRSAFPKGVKDAEHMATKEYDCILKSVTEED